jgi:hypothetical protein
MRVYRYNIVSGLYEGADFCEDREFNENDGITTLAPPTVIPGHVAVFAAELCRWKPIPIEEFEKAGNA